MLCGPLSILLQENYGGVVREGQSMEKPRNKCVLSAAP